MAISTGSSGGVTAEINVTPMIDVMLVLLIIFMVVTPLISAGFTAVMPKGATVEIQAEEDTEVPLGLDNHGAYFLNGS
ncbi:MAG TPA: biopolymer transporter ExbD, partial [Gemmatimonadales bacterium]|nr:biopolymer transporter ExbD [Gemmatimonadales bacterium]